MYHLARISLVGFVLFLLALPIHGQSAAPQSTAPNHALHDPLSNAIEITVAELSLAKLAQEKAQDSRVKSFAKMMVEDHTKALGKLRLIAGAPTSEMKPNSERQAVAERLSRLSGSEFDRDYINQMVGDHQDAVNFFEVQRKQKSSNPSLAKVADDLKPVALKHLQKAEEIRQALSGVPLPANSGLNSGNVIREAGTVPTPLNPPIPPPPAPRQ